LRDCLRSVAATPHGSRAFAFDLEESATRLRFAPALTRTTSDARMAAGGRGCRKNGTHDDAKSVMLNVRRVLGPSGPEVTCQECFELLDEYVDLALAGQDADRRLLGMREHLEGCRACYEDRESLREMVRLEGHAA
jgi:hypothetical protein